MQIRRATVDDVDEVFAMTCALALETPPQREAFEAQWRAVMGDDRSACFVAITTRPVGYALGLHAPMPIYGGGLAFLQELYVDGAHRRSGIGRQLVDAFTDWASEAGAVKVGLATSRAGEFYEALGFSTRPTMYYAQPVH